MSFNEKIQTALSSSFFRATNYIPAVCDDCLFLKEKLNESNQYKSTVDNIPRNPYALFLKKEQYHLLSNNKNWFSDVRHFFCDDCLSVFTEDFFKYTSEDKIYNKEFFVSSYDFTPFHNLENSLKIDVLTHLTLLFFKENFLDNLEPEETYCYTISPINWGMPIENISPLTLEYAGFFNSFIESPLLNHIYFDFDDVPTDLLFQENEFKNCTITRLKINQQSIQLDLNENYNPFEYINNNFSFFIHKENIMSVEYFDFYTNKWVNSFDYKGLYNLSQNNLHLLSSSDDSFLDFNYFSLNIYLKNLIQENLNELF